MEPFSTNNQIRESFREANDRNIFHLSAMFHIGSVARYQYDDIYRRTPSLDI